MRVLVTGAAGFIGSHVAEAMTAAGHDVRGLDSLADAVHAGRPSYVRDDWDLRVADVRDPDAVYDALDGVDAVCHLAAMVGLGVSLADLPLYADVNITGTAVVLDAMGRRGVPLLVLSSSMVVYGEGAYDCLRHGRVRPLPRAVADLAAGIFEPRCPSCGGELGWATVREDTAPDPRNAYATSKLAQEHLAANWARLTGGAAVALRYHNVYGPRMPRDTPYSGVAAIFRSCLENGVPPRVFEDGGQRRDFVHVRDVAESNVRGLVSCAEGGVPAGTSRAYNVASGVPHTVGEMAAELAVTFGGGPVEPIVTGEYRLGDVRHIVAAPETAASDLGFRARTSFAEGIAEFARAPLRGHATQSFHEAGAFHEAGVPGAVRPYAGGAPRPAPVLSASG
jgi:dTDP-L-rhamnose 4-epimerase